MKKLLKICSFIVAITTITVSCQKDEVGSLADSSLDENSTSVSLKEAITVSQSYFEQSAQTNKNNGRVGADSTLVGNKNKKVKKTKSYKDEKTNEDLFYVLNYEGSGFSIISADKRMNPVLAFSETNEFTDDADNLDGVREWLLATKLAIKKVKRDLKEPDEKEKQLWRQYLKQTKNGKTAITCPSDVLFDTGRYVDAIARWSQGGEYSWFSPNDNGCNCQRKPAGCGAVAMAMIMRYHRHPQTTMTFNSVSLFPNYLTMERDLASWNCGLPVANRLQTSMLIKLCGSAANSGYGVLGNCSTYTLPWNVDDAFSLMGYSNGGSWGTLSSKYNSVKDDLQNGYPVVFTGTTSIVNLNNWHIWVADGYRSYKSYYISVNNQTDITRCLSNTVEWIGMNWGWGGNCNGYFYTYYSFDTSDPFLATSGSSNNGTYNTYLNALTGIRK
jgi:hypothetical protein